MGSGFKEIRKKQYSGSNMTTLSELIAKNTLKKLIPKQSGNIAKSIIDASFLTGTTINLNSKINSTDIGVITNIKFVKVNLTSESGVKELNKSITLEAFSCNIGTFLPEGEDEL